MSTGGIRRTAGLPPASFFNRLISLMAATALGVPGLVAFQEFHQTLVLRFDHPPELYSDL